MSTDRQVLRYTRTAMVLHWLIAVLIAVNIALIWSVNLVPDWAVKFVMDTHKSTGITVLGLVILRVLWRWTHPPPPFPGNYSLLEKSAAHAVHIGLYALILAMPLSGWLHDSAWKDAAGAPIDVFYMVPWPRVGFLANLDPVTREAFYAFSGRVHAWLSYVLYALFFLHVAGALKHQLIDGDAELQRMLPSRRRNNAAVTELKNT